MRSLWLLWILVCAGFTAQAAEVAGIKFAETSEVAGQSLLLNGVGVRYRAIFKVYVAGLYLPKKSHDDKEVLAMPGAKRLHVVMLRDVEGDVLGKLLMQGIRDNNSQAETQKHLDGIRKLGQLFAERKKLMAGENFTIDFDPKLGPVIKLNGKAIGQPLNEPDFNALFLRVWLGDHPSDPFLKKGMLNQPIENRANN